MKKAFVLGAGLGTRLRPLTNVLPKPLIPVLNKPLISYAFDQLLAAGVEEFIVNTHHLPEAYDVAFPGSTYEGAPIHFAPEQPELLETGGGIANIADQVQGGDFMVYNGDILTDLPVEKAIKAHESSSNLVTLVLRSGGPNRNVGWDRKTGQVTDMRNELGMGTREQYQFTGIYLVSPEFLKFVRPVKESVVPAFLNLITQHDKLGGVVIDEGYWWDLGDREAYIEASRMMQVTDFPNFPMKTEPTRISPNAVIGEGARIDVNSCVGAGATVGAGAEITNSIIWPNAVIGEGATLNRCIVTGEEQKQVVGEHFDCDL